MESGSAPCWGLTRISVQTGVQGSWRKGNMQVDCRSRLMSVGCDDDWLLSKTGKDRKGFLCLSTVQTYTCTSTEKDHIVPRTGKNVNYSLLQFSLATVGEQVFLTLKSCLL